jgi:hypothetical protein
MRYLDRRTKTDFAVHAKMYSKLQKRVKGSTIPVLAYRKPRDIFHPLSHPILVHK